MIEMEETVPIEADHRQDGTKLDDKREGMNEGVALRHTQQILGDDHVPC